MHVCICNVSAGAHGDLKKAPGHLELKLQVAKNHSVWMQGIRLGKAQAPLIPEPSLRKI